MFGVTQAINANLRALRSGISVGVSTLIICQVKTMSTLNKKFSATLQRTPNKKNRENRR
jgi:hypothetical protein